MVKTVSNFRKKKNIATTGDEIAEEKTPAIIGKSRPMTQIGVASKESRNLNIPSVRLNRSSQKQQS